MFHGTVRKNFLKGMLNYQVESEKWFESKNKTHQLKKLLIKLKNKFLYRKRSERFDHSRYILTKKKQKW